MQREPLEVSRPAPILLAPHALLVVGKQLLLRPAVLINALESAATERHLAAPTQRVVRGVRLVARVVRYAQQPAAPKHLAHALGYRGDPVRLQLLREQLAALEIDDTQGRASLSLSGYSMGAIVHGLAIFRAKHEMGAFPLECDPYRYLGGIIRNTEAREALERTAAHLLKLRMHADELQLTPLHLQCRWPGNS
jgi:hypothetical protein